jgi:hypothetical protein
MRSWTSTFDGLTTDVRRERLSWIGKQALKPMGTDPLMKRSHRLA